jgi:hypothetical protein
MKKLLLLLLLSFNAAAQNTLIEWVPPTEDEGGNLLNDRLAGFNIYYGSLIGMYEQNNINIPDPLATYHVLDLAPGVYHGVVTAYTVDGMESAWSEDISVTVPYTPPKQVTGATWVVSE